MFPTSSPPLLFFDFCHDFMRLYDAKQYIEQILPFALDNALAVAFFFIFSVIYGVHFHFLLSAGFSRPARLLFLSYQFDFTNQTANLRSVQLLQTSVVTVALLYIPSCRQSMIFQPTIQSPSCYYRFYLQTFDLLKVLQQ